MGIGSLFKSSSRTEASLKKLRNTQTHKKLAKRVEDALMELENAVDAPVGSSNNLESIFKEVEKVLQRTVEKVAEIKLEVLDMKAFAEGEETYLTAADDILKLIPNNSPENFKKQADKTTKAQQEDRKVLSKQLSNACSDALQADRHRTAETQLNTSTKHQHYESLPFMESSNERQIQHNPNLEDEFDRKTNNIAQMIKEYFEILSSADQGRLQDPTAQENLRNLQSIILTANERIKAVYCGHELIEVYVTNLVDPRADPYRCMVTNGSTIAEIIHQILRLGTSGNTDSTEDECEEEDGDSESDAPDLYHRTPINTIKQGGYWWQWLRDGTLVNPYVADGKLKLDYVRHDEEYTLAVVDDGETERGLVLTLVMKKHKGGQLVQATVEEAVKKIIPHGRVLGIRSFSCPPKKPWTHTTLTTGSFAARQTELYVEVSHEAH